MLQLDDTTLRRGPQLLLNRTGLIIHPEQKMGLVGANGTGKSSLFALLQGELTPDNGTIRMPRVGG